VREKGVEGKRETARGALEHILHKDTKQEVVSISYLI